MQHYITSVLRALLSVLDVAQTLAFPVAIVVGLGAVALTLYIALRHDAPPLLWRSAIAKGAGYALVVLLAIVFWAVLRTTQQVARIDQKWRETAEATTNSVPDAPPVTQTGPALASLEERIYTRTLTLPPNFLERLGAEGVGTLAPYLTDPTDINISRLKDTFRRSGRDVVFTRQATRLDEVPMPFADSQVSVRFHRLAGRAYDALFEGRYLIRNATDKALKAQFIFNLPEAGTVRELKVSVGVQAVTDPDSAGAYRWTDVLQAGETREALVKYRVVGARLWHYDLGSSRRRVQNFQLNAFLDGKAGFGRGSLQPTANSDRALTWQLENVVTAQQVALVFPPDTWAKQGYLQVLSALPASFILFLIGVLAMGARERRILAPFPLAASLTLFALGLGATTVLAVYFVPLVSVIVAPLLGAALATSVLGRRFSIVVLPAALVPAAFLSAQNSGLLILLLALATLGAFAWREKTALAGKNET